MPPIIFLTTLGSNSLTAIPIIELLCLQSVFPSVLTINSLVLVSWAMNDKEEEYLSNQDNESVNRQNTSTFPPTFDLHKLFRCSLAKYCLTLLFSLSTLVIYVLPIKSREVPWNLPTKFGLWQCSLSISKRCKTDKTSLTSINENLKVPSINALTSETKRKFYLESDIKLSARIQIKQA